MDSPGSVQSRNKRGTKEEIVDSYSSCVCLSMYVGAARLEPLYIALLKDP